MFSLQKNNKINRLIPHGYKWIEFKFVITKSKKHDLKWWGSFDKMSQNWVEKTTKLLVNSGQQPVRTRAQVTKKL